MSKKEAEVKIIDIKPMKSKNAYAVSIEAKAWRYKINKVFQIPANNGTIDIDQLRSVVAEAVSKEVAFRRAKEPLLKLQDEGFKVEYETTK